MQRKNNILKSSHFNSVRSGMAMIMAIAVIVVVAGLMALSLSMTTATTKRTADLYLYEQAVLLSKSATEFALLRIAQNPACTDLDISFMQNGIYNIGIQMKYIYYDDPDTEAIDEAQAVCDALPALTRGTLYTRVTTPEQNGSVMMDVTISVLKTRNVTSEPIRYFKRTIQKL